MEPTTPPAAIVRAARHVRDAEYAIEVVVVGDDAAAPTWHLHLERSLDPDAQDRELGWDDYCLVLTDGSSAYGCLREIDLTERSLRLEVTEQSCADLGLSGTRQDIALDLDAAQLAELAGGLASILRDSPSAPRLRGMLGSAPADQP